MSEKQPTTPAAILRAARAKIERPEKWTKHAAARSASGVAVHVASDAAICWCARGAVLAVSESRYEADVASFFLMQAAQERVDVWRNASYASEVALNDHPYTDHADVLALYDDAIALADTKEPR